MTSAPLFNLIYVSSASREYDTVELTRIIDDCYKPNVDNQITGMLLYSKGTFMQLLEGSQENVLSTFDRIKRDDRHHGIITILTSTIASRSFANWVMGFHALHDDDFSKHPGYVRLSRSGFDPVALQAQPGLAFNMLSEFAHR